MVDEVVADERVEQVGVPVEVGVAIATSWRSRVVPGGPGRASQARSPETGVVARPRAGG